MNHQKIKVKLKIHHRLIVYIYEEKTESGLFHLIYK